MDYIRADFYRKYIERYNKPSNSDIHYHIKNITKEKVFSVKYYTDIIPVVGDIVSYNGVNYEILKRIFVSDNSNLMSVVYEVRVYPKVFLKQYGSTSWDEEIPLVIDIPDNQS